MHFSAPSHPLIHAFLLARADFSEHRYVIVETSEQAKKLLQNLEGLKKMFPKKFHHEYRIICSELDALELAHDLNIVGIYSLPLPEYFGISPEAKGLILDLSIDMQLGEEKCINWLVEHGYQALKSDEVGTYFRVGDTISIVTKKGLLQVSFMGAKIEDMFLSSEKIQEFQLFALK